MLGRSGQAINHARLNTQHSRGPLHPGHGWWVGWELCPGQHPSLWQEAATARAGGTGISGGSGAVSCCTLLAEGLAPAHSAPGRNRPSVMASTVN